MAIDRLPSDSFRGRLMINGQRYTASLPTEADARLWEIETRANASLRRRSGRVTFAAYAATWLAGFIDDAPDRARFEAALEHRFLPVLGSLLLLSRCCTQTETNWSANRRSSMGMGLTARAGVCG